ncbi:MAG: MiaB/RimO family radical SAM methylthiotransferase [Planctomycetaceae bacterium]|nr:MiaB/RimO family radical SAM methylthiotransferase [Planctomycetaceae bacterium]
MPDFTIISLGCPKNMVDSENLVGRLIKAGYTFHERSEHCDFTLVNTCGFLQAARDEAREVLDELVALKNDRQIKRIFVTGCLVNFEKMRTLKEYKEQLVRENLDPDFDDYSGIDIECEKLYLERIAGKHPDVDAWVGVYDEPRIVEIVGKFFPQPPEEPVGSYFWIGPPPQEKLELDDSHRHLLLPQHVAYLRIADGCDRHCTYCAIPAIRGRFVSKPKEIILDEAKKLIDAGTKELVLIAQETTFWGTDLYGKPMLASLLESLKNLPGNFWIRLMYTYPLHFGDDLIELFAEKNGKILPYIDLPLQHASDAILKRMNRQVNRAETEHLLEKLRTRIDDLVLRTSLIVGFPGETDEMFQELLAFVHRWGFQRGGVFAFSAEPGTAATKFTETVPPKKIQKRLEHLLRTLGDITDHWDASRIGKRCDVLIDQPIFAAKGKELDSVYWGRSYAEAPEIDPQVVVNGKNLTVGDKVPCEIVQVQDGNLIAVALDQE